MKIIPISRIVLEFAGVTCTSMRGSNPVRWKIKDIYQFIHILEDNHIAV